MKLLLDTHVFLWRLMGDPRLSRSAESLLNDPANQLYLSSASAFEIAAKNSAGKLRLPIDIESFLKLGLQKNQIAPLELTFSHVYAVETLPMIHRDPFDRLLISTAIAEGMTLLTDDAIVRSNPLLTIW